MFSVTLFHTKPYYSMMWIPRGLTLGLSLFYRPDIKFYHRVVLHDQTSTLTNVTAGVTQGFILGPLLFLIYINNLSEGLSTNAKLFANDTSLFSVIHDNHTSVNALNKDLEMIQNWAFQWKMNFNPDPTKQAQEVNFSIKTKKLSSFSSLLDSKITFENHRNIVTTKINDHSTPP